MSVGRGDAARAAGSRARGCAPSRADSNASNANVVQLKLSEPEWRQVTSLLQGGQELPEEPLEELEGGN